MCNEDNNWENFLKQQEKIDQKDEKVLNEVKAKVTEDVFKDIETSLGFSDLTYIYKITNKPQGKFQVENKFNVLDGQWVNQIIDGGYTGDEFAGTISIKIGDNEYFQYNYELM